MFQIILPYVAIFYHQHKLIKYTEIDIVLAKYDGT